MTNQDAERLRRIHNYTQLINYLRDELEWPFYDFDDPDEISFEWSLDELGISPEHAARIQEVRQLRPPTGDWPWGIFYVKFEKKHLPITILRRALSRLVTKQRASANSGQRWDLEDLLFISSFGEGEQRQISFARFQAPAEGGNRLPELKVLAWDADDRDLSLQHTASVLREKLAWPEDESDFQGWREQWSGAFVRGHRETIRTSKALASRLAELAQAIRGRIERTIRLETEDGPLRGLMESFRGSLVHDLDEAGFADMYAQTIAYGLFSARATHPDQVDAGSLLSVPVTNPFLRELLGTFLQVGGRTEGGVGIDFDELGVNEVVDQLNDTDIEAVLRDFDDKNPLEDPVIHFFEGFLGEYDKKVKKDRGVFYTPRPVVSFIVRSVDELLRTEFGLEDGLADTTTWGEVAGRIDDLEIPEGATATQAFVQILDPATGTGTFLVEVIDLIHRTMTAKWQTEGHTEKEIEELWNDYVPEHLLPRLHGYELMMAPYAIAHMKIGLKLYETAYRFESDERARVYLTNALEPAQDFSGTLAFAIPALAHEAEAVNAIKRDQRFTVVIGNPPYASISSNLTPELRKTVDRYRYVDGEKIRERSMLQFEKNIQDDYVKFLALAQSVVDDAPLAVCGLITNHSFLDGPTLRGVRWNLITSFDKCFFIDLHGNANKAEKPPSGEKDENVFAIRQGVAVSFLVSQPGVPSGRTFHLDVWGDHLKKFKFLSTKTANSSECQVIHPAMPDFLIVPEDDDEGGDEWFVYVPIGDVFTKRSTGTESGFDDLLVAFNRSELADSLQRFSNHDTSDAEVRDSWGITGGHAEKLVGLRAGLEGDQSKHFRAFQLRAFDYRVGLMRKEMLKTNSFNVMLDLSSCTPGLVTTRQTKEDFGVYAVSSFAGHKCTSSYDRSYIFPLFTEESGGIFKGKQANIANDILAHFSNLVRSSGGVFREGDVPISVFRYAYAVLSAPGYASRFASRLKRGWPRIPLIKRYELFRALDGKGGELLDLHLLLSSSLSSPISSLVGVGDFQVEKVSYSDKTVWIDKPKTRGFKGVPEEVWNFHIGGYQVCEKWLKDRQAKGGKNPRPGRVLTDEDIEHYQKIVVAISETIRIQAEIDEVIEAHGGWPGAFLAETGSDSVDVELGGASLAADAPAE